MSRITGGDGETITVLSAGDGFDRDGNPLEHPEGETIFGCVVEPAGQTKIEDRDVVSGDTTTLRVHAPAGTVVEEGATVLFRGEEYVVQFVPFDYSVGRRPALARHQPRTLFIIEQARA